MQTREQKISAYRSGDRERIKKLKMKATADAKAEALAAGLPEPPVCQSCRKTNIGQREFKLAQDIRRVHIERHCFEFVIESGSELSLPFESEIEVDGVEYVISIKPK